MNTPSITLIRERRDNVKKSLRNFKISKFKDSNYGGEEEFTAEKLLESIETILAEVTALTKRHSQFIQKSDLSERNHLVTWLTHLNSYIVNEDLDNIAVAIDQIKPTLRNIGIYFADEKLRVSEERLNELQKYTSSLSQQIIAVKDIKSEIDKLKEEIEGLHEKLVQKHESLDSQSEELTASISSTEQKRSDLANLLDEDEVRSQEIETLLSTSKSHIELIDNFSKKVRDRENQLEDQEISTQRFMEKLEAFNADHENYLSEAKELIENSKRALEYTTAEGLSAAFTERHNISNQLLPKIGWLSSGGIFVAAAVWIGYSLTTGESTNLASILARISLLPILIAGAWFCAGQYVKQKNIAEDYAYKAAIAKSIVGFSEKLSTQSDKGEDYFSFMKFALSQMLNDPLRKHARKESTSFENFKNAMQFWKNEET